MSIKAVCFDFGGVYSKHKAKEHDWKDVWRDMQKQIGKKFPYELFAKMQNDLDKGRRTLRQHYLELFKKIRKDFTEKELKKFSKPRIAKARLNPEIQRLVSVLNEKGYKTPMVSNSIKEVARIRRKQGCYNIFDPVFVSCEVGFSKADGSIYKLVRKRLKLRSEECLMVDDNPEFIRTAKKAGLKAILYINPNKLRTELKSFGVKL